MNCIIGYAEESTPLISEEKPDMALLFSRCMFSQSDGVSIHCDNREKHLKNRVPVFNRFIFILFRQDLPHYHYFPSMRNVLVKL